MSRRKCGISNWYDRMMAPVERASLAARRRELMENVGPTVLEIGSGTGANLSCYPVGSTLFATDPDPDMFAIQRTKASERAPCWTFSAARAEALPFPNESLDSVVSTLVLCSVAEPGRAVSEIWRILRPGGAFLFLEHVRGEGRRGRWQDRLKPLWTRVSCGCHPNRKTLDTLVGQGFRLDQAVAFNPFCGFPRYSQWFLGLVLPFVQGCATKPGRNSDQHHSPGQGLLNRLNRPENILQERSNFRLDSSISTISGKPL